MSENATYILYGAEPSFFTQKGLALFTAKGLDVDFRLKSLAVKADVEAAVGGYAKLPVVQTPRGDWLKDTTDIALILDQRHPETRLIPTDPVWAILARILDDYVDEWVIRPAFHWRALETGAASRVWRTLARNLMGLSADQPLIDEQEAKMLAVADRLTDFATHVARVNRTGPGFEAEIEAMLNEICDAVSAAAQPFLLGDAPSLPDLALAGGLFGHFLWEDAPRAWISERHPRILDYAARLKGAQAPTQWILPDRLSPGLNQLLSLIARTYHRFLYANERALSQGVQMAVWDSFEMPVRKYTEKQRQSIAAMLDNLSMTDSIRLGKLTAGTNILDVFTPPN
jgi:glutathione S-transferase